jgi:formylglycine-generating enzyme required for sulfatase activity
MAGGWSWSIAMTDANVIIDSGRRPLINGVPPIWATAWGKDEFGVYASFSINEVSQRLRWIPPGRFWMGSPGGEAGRYYYERPRHEVTIASGFWMMDTPVRQCLWQAVMDDNPSCFKSPDRPVESVDLEMIQQFLSRLNGEVAGLELALPSEAQWEYACRAGGETATYAGDLEILGVRNAPVLDRIAWYGGNSGVGFELDNGVDSSSWPEKQYPDTPSGTHPVGKKLPNALGLHDMLGNVWEWCADHWHADYDGAPTNASAWIEDDAAADRVVRGGSWGNHARDVRAAYRFHGDPADRHYYLGFRCVRVQS